VAILLTPHLTLPTLSLLLAPGLAPREGNVKPTGAAFPCLELFSLSHFLFLSLSLSLSLSLPLAC
jgi:hypothetical protein